VFGKSPLYYCVRKCFHSCHEREGILIRLSLLESTWLYWGRVTLWPFRLGVPDLPQKLQVQRNTSWQAPPNLQVVNWVAHKLFVDRNLAMYFPIQRGLRSDPRETCRTKSHGVKALLAALQWIGVFGDLERQMSEASILKFHWVTHLPIRPRQFCFPQFFAW